MYFANTVTRVKFKAGDQIRQRKRASAGIRGTVAGILLTIGRC